jgi:hypothetical protein
MPVKTKQSSMLSASVPIHALMKTVFLPIALLLLTLTSGRATTLLDQEQTQYYGGLSALTTAGDSVGQSFMAGVSGTLSEIDMGFFDDISGVGQLQILDGSGLGAPTLATETVSVTSTTSTGVSWNDWQVNVPVIAGHVYTFMFTPGAGIPNPYGVAIGQENSYTRGTLYLWYQGSPESQDFQTVFRTYVTLPPSSAGNSSPTPILQYNFNETGTTAASTGAIPVPLTFLDSSGSAADLHTADALGVSGMTGDRAFDNTASTGMGKGYTGGVGEVPAGTIGTLDSFTYQCWYNVATPIDNLARFLEDTHITLSAANSQLTLYVNGTSVSSSPNYGGTNQWIFMAVTYDGTKTSNNVQFYIGTKNTPVVPVELPLSLNGGSVIQDHILAIGNYNNGNVRPMDGYMDDVRLYGSATDSTGVLTQTRLEALRQQDAVNGQDSLVGGQISISGDILQNGTNGDTIVTPVTVRNVLKLLGVTGAPPADSLRVYFDESTQSYVIAPKSDEATGLGFPTATIVSLAGTGVIWNTTSHSFVAAYSVTGLNGALGGTARLNDVSAVGLNADTLHATLFGMFGGLQTIMECGVVDLTGSLK